MTGWEGMRNATVSRPPVTALRTDGCRSRTIVRGPGQNASASRDACSGMRRAQSARFAPLPRCTIKGWSAGRPLAANTRETASGSDASAARP
jgi:hypothetical protein